MSFAVGTSSSSESSRGNASEEAKQQKVDLVKQIRAHEVALAELNALPSFRAVYQKNANIYFRTTTQKATESNQKLLDQAKSQLQRLNSS